MQNEQPSSDSSHHIPNDPNGLANGQTNDSSDEGEEDGEVYRNNYIDSTLLEWIKVNKLTFIKEILLQQEISLTEISALSHHQRRQFVDSLQIENPIFEKRLLNAVLLLNEHSNNHQNNDNNHSNNHHDIDNKIQKKKEFINNSIKNANDCMEVLQIKMQTNQKKIEEIYNEVIVAANKYKQIALDKSTEVYDMKFNVLKVKLNKFKEMKQRIIEYTESEENNIDDILAVNENENIMNMVSNTDIIQLKVGDGEIDEYIKNILCVNSVNSMVSVPKINITDIEKDCISIHILHGENDYDLNVTKYEIKYYEVYEQFDKIINGHKYNSQIIDFNMNKKENKTKYKLEKLKPATNYAIAVRLYSFLLSKWSLFCKNIYIKTNKYIHYGGRVMLKDKIINHSFVNCIIHCLSNTIDLKNYFISLQWKQCITNKNSISYIFGNLLLDIWSNRYNTIPHSISQFISSNINKDPFKFLVFLLETLHSDLNVQKQNNNNNAKLKPNRSFQWKQYINNNQSKIIDLFAFQFKTDITCIQCKKHFITYNICKQLSFGINKSQRKSFIIDIFHRGNNNNNAGSHGAYNNATNKPVRHIFHHSPYGSMKDLAKIIAKSYGVKRQFVLFYENNNMKVVREYEHKMLIKNVPNHKPFSCYILKDWNREITAEEVKMKKITLWLARLCHGITTNHNQKYYNKNSHKSHHLFGMPFVLSFISIHTNKDIYKHVYERLYIWLGRDYLKYTPPKISTRQGPKDIENEMKTYDIDWNQILYKKLPFKLKLIHSNNEISEANTEIKWNEKDISEVPVNDNVFDNVLYVKSKHVDILIEWKSNNIYERIRKVMNKVIVDTEYSKWKKLKKSHHKNNESENNNLNLYDLFDSYVSKKRIGDSNNNIQNGNIHLNDKMNKNLHFCTRCKKKQRYTKKIDMCTFPKYLIIHLQRRNENKNKFVECPLNALNLTKYKISNKLNKKYNSMDNMDEIIMDGNFDQKQNDMVFHLSYDDEQTVPPIYDLYATVQLENESKYCCYIKSKSNNASSSSFPSISHAISSEYKWYYFNDDKITLIENESQIISPNTYLLFYKKR